MPRLATSLITKARAISPYLVSLVKTCRDIPSALRELRWITEHVSRVLKVRTSGREVHETCERSYLRSEFREEQALLKRLCFERGRGVPLQYLLGSEFFGELEIACRKGVLIPRPETADIVLALVRGIQSGLTSGILRWSHSEIATNSSSKFRIAVDARGRTNLRILDLCTGTGCMSLLLAYELEQLSDITTHTLGIDISPRALNLARANLRRLYANKSLNPVRTQFTFKRANLLLPATGSNKSSYEGPPIATPISHSVHHNLHSTRRKTCRLGRRCRRLSHQNLPSAPSIHQVLHRFSPHDSNPPPFDILLANPPYISPQIYMHTTTSRSVRSFEPKLALVPIPSAPRSASNGTDLARGDEFYIPILEIARNSKVRVVLMEVGDLEQAMRVAKMAMRMNIWAVVEVWRDGLNEGVKDEVEVEIIDDIFVYGHKDREGRAVVCYRAES